jgi:cytochrome bd-type quinol oxidase subunit 1
MKEDIRIYDKGIEQYFKATVIFGNFMMPLWIVLGTIACRNLVKKEPIKVMDLLKVDEYKYKKRIHKRC